MTHSLTDPLTDRAACFRKIYKEVEIVVNLESVATFDLNLNLKKLKLSLTLNALQHLIGQLSSFLEFVTF